MTFAKHCEESHNMWNYIFYLAYIHEKNITEHSGEESYVYQQFKSGSINWIPFKRCMQIDLDSENDEVSSLRLAKKIEEDVNSLWLIYFRWTRSLMLTPRSTIKCLTI